MSASQPTAFDGRLGARLVRDGVQFAVHAARRTRARLLLFPDAEATAPSRVLELDPVRDRSGSVWHVTVPDAGPGWSYNWQIAGPDEDFTAARALLDPYGLAVAGWDRYDRKAAASAVDNTATALRSVVTTPETYDWADDTPPPRPDREFIAEVHVGAFTADASSGLDAALRGTYAGLAAKADHLVSLGVTAVELMPVYAYDPQDAPAGRVNYWGYSPLSFFAPHPGYAQGNDPLAALDEFRDMVRTLHAKGLRVYLDVVYNHTAEAGPEGPDLSWRGFDEDAYYMREPGFARYRDFTGCGNTFNANHPVAARMVTDSLRWWARHMHVDGFRFDLAAAHVRGEDGTPLENPPVIGAVDTDPALADTRLIAEPWDTGGLHFVGGFPGRRFACWNGPYRDTVRRFLKGDGGTIEELMARLVGSPDLFSRPHERPASSINFVTCHDGFTLRDLVSYNRKHNLENGEDNRDGSDNNLSWNSGAEGPSPDPTIEELRARRVRNFLVLLFFSHGTPMLLAGDEWGQTRDGNNNPWCLDNPRNWLDWSLAETHADLVRFTRRAWTLAAEVPVLRSREFWTATNPERPGEITWHGRTPGQPDWTADSRHLAWELGAPGSGERVLLACNMESEPTPFVLPPSPPETGWHRVLDTAAAAPDDAPEAPGRAEPAGAALTLESYGIMVWRTWT